MKNDGYDNGGSLKTMMSSPTAAAKKRGTAIPYFAGKAPAKQR
jgi:hypothetical protein